MCRALIALREFLKIEAISPVTAPKEILSELLPRLNNRLITKRQYLGESSIKDSKVVNFDGLGQQFGGLYRITQATHTIDSSGYRKRNSKRARKSGLVDPDSQ